MLVHAEQVARKNSRFVAAGAAADFHDGVLAVVGIGRDEQQLDFLLQRRHFGLKLRNLLARHLPEFIVFLVQEYILGRLNIVQQLLILVAFGDYGFQLLVILVELDIFLHVGHHGRIRQLVLDGFEFSLE